jgi:hypothetical protein
MASRRRARNRQARDPQTVLIDAQILVAARHNSRNRKRLIAARMAYADRVTGAIPTISGRVA